MLQQSSEMQFELRKHFTEVIHLSSWIKDIFVLTKIRFSIKQGILQIFCVNISMTCTEVQVRVLGNNAIILNKNKKQWRFSHFEGWNHCVTH